MSRPLVSAITTFLNGERFLGEAIESVLAQTHPEWELLLVDDGSTDGATAIARGYAQRYPDRVTYLEHAGHANRGISASRNLAIAAARGAYVAFLDADDVWVPDKLEAQLALLEASPGASAIYGNTLYWRSWTGDAADAGADYYPVLGVRDGTVATPPALLVNMLRGRTAVPCVHSFVVRTDALRRIGGFEERFRGMFEDQAFYAKLFLSEPVLVVERSWERYRLHDDSCCAVAKREGVAAEARHRFLEWLDGHLATTGAGDEAVRNAVRRALWPYRHPRLERLRRRASSIAGRLARRARQSGD
ncbi:MAG TPA: glycosyltransferase family A protein [Gemmatimonadaceae bacterium]|nr:glycosyltransferase family A protein [Gemmatimonadaceae bacterium]